MTDREPVVEGLSPEAETKFRESVAAIEAMEQQSGADEWALHWSNGVARRLLATLDDARAALREAAAPAELLDVENIGRLALAMHTVRVNCNPLLPDESLRHRKLHREDAEKIAAAYAESRTFPAGEIPE